MGEKAAEHTAGHAATNTAGHTAEHTAEHTATGTTDLPATDTSEHAASHTAARLVVAGLSVVLGGHAVLDGLDLSVRPGEIVAIQGRSGSGKSTLLRLIAGLDAPASGTITIDGRSMNGGRHIEPPHARGIGFLFQRAALWPHLRVRDNIACAVATGTRTVRAARATELLAAVGIAQLADRYPDEISGGEARRVALARALAARPGLVLLDEPLASVDAERRAELRELIAGVVSMDGASAANASRAAHGAPLATDEIAPAVVWVTHDPDEAAIVAHRVLRLQDGRLHA